MDRLGGVNGGGGGGERTPLLGQGVGFLYFVFSFCMQSSANGVHDTISVHCSSTYNVQELTSLWTFLYLNSSWSCFHLYNLTKTVSGSISSA